MSSESLSVLLERVNSGESLLICNKDEASANFHGQFDKHKCEPLDARQNLASIPRIKRGSHPRSTLSEPNLKEKRTL